MIASYGTEKIIAPFIKFFQLIMVYFIIGFLNNSIEFNTVMQVGVFLIFIISMIWFIHHSYQLAEIPFLGMNPGLSENLKEKFSDKYNAFTGQNFSIFNHFFKLSLTAGIYRIYFIIRNYLDSYKY